MAPRRKRDPLSGCILVFAALATVASGGLPRHDFPAERREFFRHVVGAHERAVIIAECNAQTFVVAILYAVAKRSIENFALLGR